MSQKINPTECSKNTLLAFDMDGTLLDSTSKISKFTAETLRYLHERDIDYTIATGRTLQAAEKPLLGHHFCKPMILKNGTVIWHPLDQKYSHRYLLVPDEINHLLTLLLKKSLNPFIFTLDSNDQHAVFHAPLKHHYESKLSALFENERSLPLLPLSKMPSDARVINISAVGTLLPVADVCSEVNQMSHLVAYSGVASKIDELHWLDVHHTLGSKGNAIKTVRTQLGYNEVIVFGDGDNDISMFAAADEAYATANADERLKECATATIGHHDKDGVAHFLRERFDL